MRIEEIGKQALKDTTDLELKQLKYKFAKFWERHFKHNSKEIVGCFERADFIAKYRLLLKEMDSQKRSLQHSTCDIDRQAFKQSMQVKADGIDFSVFSEILTKKNYIILDKDFAKTDEIKITIAQTTDLESFSQFIEKEITKVFKEQFDKPCVFVYEQDFEGDGICLFHEVLCPAVKLQKIEIKSDGTEIEKDIVIVPLEKEKGDEHIVYGIVYEPNEVDAQGDQANAEEIKKAAYDFMENVQTFKVNHKNKKVKVKILENYIAPVEFTIEKRNVKKGSWVLVLRILDGKIWKSIKKGELTGYSMAGYAKVD